MIGTIFLNRYRLDAEMGRGGMGIVYQAHDLLLERQVAVKVLSDLGFDTEGRARLLREAQAVARLNHPNVVTIHDVGEASGSPFIVMEFVSGQRLDRLPPLALSSKVDIAGQICAALEHAHLNGIIHRDLKPANILIQSAPDAAVGPEIRVKLMDFGLAQTAETLQPSIEGALIGTPFYIAPEIIQGRPASPQSDLYALGVMLYEFIAGRPPFTGDNLLAIASQHLYAPVVPPSTYIDLPPALEAILLQLLSKQPTDRPASAEALRQALEQIDFDKPEGAARAPGAAGPVSLLDRIARGRLVARQAEMAEARRLWDQAVHGQGGVLLISGEPGVGKTRLAREVLARAQLNGALTLTGECFAEGAAPYTPLAQMIAGADLSALPPVLVADLVALAPALRASYPDLPANPVLDPLAERQRIFDNVAAWLASVSTPVPVLMFVDDVHWADGGSLLLLLHLARRARNLRVLIVLTYREIELDETHPLHGMLIDLNRERLAVRLKLRRLDRDETRALLEALFQEAITPEFLDGIFRETDGNPFFVEEVCKTLVDSGKLVRAGGRWQRADMDQIEIPQSVRLALEWRLARLPAPAQEALRAAAILGREFEFEVLRAMDDEDEETLIDALEAAERAQLIAEVKRPGPAVFAFGHALIPLTLREGMGALRRQRLHRLAAQAIEQVHAARLAGGDFAAALGRHYAEAGDLEQASGQYLQAAERARGVYSYPEAIEHYRRAMVFLKELGPAALARAARTAMTLAQLYHSVFDFERSQLTYAEGFALWQRVEEEQRKAALPLAPHALRLFRILPVSLDVTVTSLGNDHGIIRQLFSGLVESTPELDLMPALARSWEILDQGRRYVFHLRPDARWSDGRPVTAHDFEFTWKRQLDPAQAAPFRELFFDIRNARACYAGRARPEDVGVRAMGDFTLSVELEEPVGHFLHVLASAATFAMPRHAVEAWGGSDWARPDALVTNGPFRLAEWRPGERLVLERNPDYRGRRTGNVARIELAEISRLAAQGIWQAYEAGACDAITLTTSEERDRARRQYPGEYVQHAAAVAMFVIFMARQPPFDDMRVRQAFQLAIDRRVLADTLFRGLRAPALGGILPPGFPGHSAEMGLPYDVERAQRLLAQAGYPGGRGLPAIQAFLNIQGGLLARASAYLREQWQVALGADVQWLPLSHQAWLEQQAWQATHLAAIGWGADYPDPHTFLNVALHMYAGDWRDPNYEKLLDAAQHMTDQAERIKIYQAAERILVDSALVMPLTYGREHLLIKPWVRQYLATPLGWQMWKDAILDPH